MLVSKCDPSPRHFCSYDASDLHVGFAIDAIDMTGGPEELPACHMPQRAARTAVAPGRCGIWPPLRPTRSAEGVSSSITALERVSSEGGTNLRGSARCRWCVTTPPASQLQGEDYSCVKF